MNTQTNMKEEILAFFEAYKKMRDAQIKERWAQGEESVSVREYNNIFYYQYLAEKSADEMFHKLSQKYSI